ncbi:pilus assembly protein, partial [Candidatus Magnetomorum sp. HK-1]
RKEFVIKYQMACLVDKVRAFIGIYSFNQSIVFPVQHVDPSEKELTEAKKAILEQIYSYISKGDSPLREAYQTVGNYLDTGSDSVIKGRSPFIQNTEGDSCRQAFVVVLTDGDYNGPSPNIGNCDIDGGSNDSLFDGPPYGDLYENTFADLSMYYYERDLAPGIPNMIPAFASDIASHQHMVPLIIVFDSKDMKDKYSNYPEWPKPSPETGQTMIDLFHAAVNGRGFFGNAGDPFEFSDVIQQIDGYIQNSQTIISGSTQVGSSVQTQSQRLETSYNSINWTGDLKAYDISSAQT